MQPPLRLLSAVLVAILMVLGAVFTAATADKVKVWKWTDATGTVVYSQQPPPGQIKAEEKYIDPDRSVIESGWLPPAAPATAAVPSAEQSAARDSRSRRIARQGGGASTEEPAEPEKPAVPPPVEPPPPPPALAVPSPPPVTPPPPPPAPAVPSPGPGGF